MIVERLTTAPQWERYASFPERVFRGNPHFRPGDAHHVIESISNQSPYATHSRAQAFWAREEDDVQAVVTALIDQTYWKHRGERAGHLLYFDAMPDGEDAAVAVLGQACEWLREQGAGFARFGLKFGWQMPMTVDAYDVPPTIFHTFNPPYYHCFVKNAGFATEKGAVELRVQFTPELAARYQSLASANGVTLRQWNFSQIEEENRRLTALLNEAFAKHWGAGPFQEKELAGLTVGMRECLVPEFCWFAECEGEPAGFVYSLPDLNQGESIDHGVLLIIGVREKFRGRGVNTALGARSYLAMMDRGYKSASYTVVLDDNWPSRRTAEKLGCRVARNFAIYRRGW